MLNAGGHTELLPDDEGMIIAGSIMPYTMSGRGAPLQVTALVVEGDVRVALVSCDVIALTRDLCDRASARIEAATGIPADHVLVAATHTHSAPTTISVHGYEREDRFCVGVEDTIVRAVAGACETLSEVEFVFGQGWEDTVPKNSRIVLTDGSIAWSGYDRGMEVRPTAPIDPSLAVVGFRKPEGAWAGLAFNHTCHNLSRGGAPGRSPEFYGLAAQALARPLRAPTVFLNGAFGSTHNLEVPRSEAAERVRRAVLDALDRSREGLFGPVQSVKRQFSFQVRRFDEEAEAAAVHAWCGRWFKDAGDVEAVFRAQRASLRPYMGVTRTTWLHGIAFGDVALLGVPGELFTALGLEIKRRSPFRHTLVVGLANDWIGYIPTTADFDRGGYQVWTGLHSLVERGTGEQMVDAAVEILREMVRGFTGEAAPGGTVVLRRARVGDAPELQRFYNGLSRASRRTFRPLGWNATMNPCEEVVAGNTSEPETRFDLFAVEGSRMVGWGFVSGLDKDVPGFGLGVADDHQGRGLGRRLMAAVMEECRQRGKVGIELCVVQDNERAWKLYESFGFRRIGTHRGSDGLEYLDMRVEFG